MVYVVLLDTHCYPLNRDQPLLKAFLAMELNYARSTGLFIRCLYIDCSISDVEVLKLKGQLWRTVAQRLRYYFVPTLHINCPLWYFYPSHETLFAAMENIEIR